MASRKTTAPSGRNCGLTGGAGASGTGAADSGGLAADCAWAAALQIELQIIVAKTKRDKLDQAAGREGCDIRSSPWWMQSVRFTVYRGVRVCEQRVRTPLCWHFKNQIAAGQAEE